MKVNKELEIKDKAYRIVKTVGEYNDGGRYTDYQVEYSEDNGKTWKEELMDIVYYDSELPSVHSVLFDTLQEAKAYIDRVREGLVLKATVVREYGIKPNK